MYIVGSEGHWVRLALGQMGLVDIGSRECWIKYALCRTDIGFDGHWCRWIQGLMDIGLDGHWVGWTLGWMNIGFDGQWVGWTLGFMDIGSDWQWKWKNGNWGLRTLGQICIVSDGYRV